MLLLRAVRIEVTVPDETALEVLRGRIGDWFLIRSFSFGSRRAIPSCALGSDAVGAIAKKVPRVLSFRLRQRAISCRGHPRPRSTSPSLVGAFLALDQRRSRWSKPS